MKSRLEMGLTALALAVAAVVGALALAESTDIIVRIAEQTLATSPVIIPSG